MIAFKLNIIKLNIMDDNTEPEQLDTNLNENTTDHHHPQTFSQPHPQQPDKKKRLFSKELRCMMYGFGDDQNPYTETVDMLEDLVISFIGSIVLQALEIGRVGRVTVEDVMYLVRQDPRKYARVKDLLSMNEELKRARKAFDEVEYVQKKKKFSKMSGSFKSTLNPGSSHQDLKN